MTEPYIFKRLSDDNLSDLLVLIKDLYNREESIENLKLKYDTSAWGVKNIGFIAYSNEGEVAAYYGVFPTEFVFQGRKILAAQSGDTMTHSKHQRKGLFVQLAKITYELAKEEGIQFVFGFPNDNSFPGFQKKMDWKFQGKMKNYNFLVPTVPSVLISERLNVKPLKKISHSCSLAVISFFSNKNGKFNQSYMADDACFVINKDEKYFKYKNKKQHFIIDSKNISAWVKFDGSISIGDISILGNPTHLEAQRAFRRLLRKIKWIAFLAGIVRIRLYVSPESKIDQLLNGQHAFRDSLNVGYLDFVNCVNDNKLQFTYADYDTF